jgi:hypothetical protein
VRGEGLRERERETLASSSRVFLPYNIPTATGCSLLFIQSNYKINIYDIIFVL